MKKSPGPFSFSGKEKEERPRKAKQNRFFEPDRNASTAKFEKLHERPHEGGGALKLAVENADVEPSLNIEVVSNSEEIVNHEVKRVRWYLKEYARYKSLGYDSVIRFPAGINPEDTRVTDDEIRHAIQQELRTNQADYEAYAHKFKETWDLMSGTMLPVVAQVYGFSPSGHFKIVPTAYGTGGGSLEKDGVVFFRLPKFRPQNPNGKNAGKPITEVEAITHEILCHEVTAHLREHTAIDDSPILATHQEHKERLMDLLGKTLLVRSGMMKREEVHMVGGGIAAAADIDPLYYADPEHQDEKNLRFEGKLPDLIRVIEAKLKEISH